MGLKGHRLWDMGQMNSTCRAPPRLGRVNQHHLFLAVALQVAFERQTLKPVFPLDRLQVMGLKGYRLWAMGQRLKGTSETGFST